MDINGGQLTQSNGNPALPGTTFTGPLIAGNVLHSDGTSNLAGVGGQNGLANTGYVVMAQTSVITQATNGSVAGVWTDPNIIIPANKPCSAVTATMRSLNSASGISGSGLWCSIQTNTRASVKHSNAPTHTSG